ncbi:hypothetical protein ACBI99_33315 [Nonomuraea sp. ATR24]|uniref:hypothetical protein n=1 Tax=Nonomuraea TaxID=83681 RepID=UPI001C5D2C0C|nr:hypothetical protein [Nonomuraea ceibae]
MSAWSVQVPAPRNGGSPFDGSGVGGFAAGAGQPAQPRRCHTPMSGRFGESRRPKRRAIAGAARVTQDGTPEAAPWGYRATGARSASTTGADSTE